MMSNTEVMNRGITCLLESLGTVETEQFISLIIKEKFDYTEWQRKKFDGVSPEDFNAKAVAYAKKNPLRANQ